MELALLPGEDDPLAAVDQLARGIQVTRMDGSPPEPELLDLRGQVLHHPERRPTTGENWLPQGVVGKSVQGTHCVLAPTV
jgi:hypothetical protein